MELSFPNGATKTEISCFQKLPCLGLITDEDFAYHDDVEPNDTINYCVRVLLIDKGEICVVESQKYDFVQILGGHVEGNESIEEAARRESLEEGGYEITDLMPQGYFIENGIAKKSISFVYTAKPGRKSKTAYTEDEIECEFCPLWCSFEEALNTLTNADKQYIKSYNGRFATKRDLKLFQYLVKDGLNED